jgi:hypothetical protein
LAALGLQVYQGADQAHKTLLSTLLYFDSFRTSAAFLDRFDEFGFRYGHMVLSSSWDYVPRGLYHAKPRVFGQMMVDEMLFPGAAETIHAFPGMMTWTMGYGDFGVIGVVLAGLFDAFLAKGAYEFFLDRKDIQSMALFAQLGLSCFITMIFSAPFPLFFIWLIFQIALIRFLSMFRLFPPFHFVLSPTRMSRL